MRLGPVLLAAVAACCPPRLAAAGGPGTPDGAVRAFYEALDRHDCAAAVRLRPGDYTIEKCRAVTRAGPARTRVKHARDDLAVVEVKVDYVRGGGPPERFDGYVTLRRTADGWAIVPRSFVSRADRSVEEYLRKFARVAPAPPPRAAAPAEPALDRPRLPRDILDACWSDDQLVGRRERRVIKSRATPDTRPPDPADPAVALPPLPEGWQGSIRSVELPAATRRVALTFDLCERASETTGYDVDVVNALRRANIPATFFAGGKWMRSHPEETMQLMADPRFELGNHAWTHGNLRVLRGREMVDQIRWTQAQYETLRQALAEKPCVQALGPGAMRRVPTALRLFRFPYGTCSPEALATLAELGLAAIQWSVVSGDPARGQTPAALIRAVVDHVTPGAIVVMHANGRGRATGSALPAIIDGLRERDYEFVTVSALLRGGRPRTVPECYENRPGDNLRYDTLFGRGTGD